MSINTDCVSIENAKIIFRNFSGAPGKYNKSGNRNFCVVLDNDISRKMENDGWNIKVLKPRNDDEEPGHYIQVSLNFDYRPPKIFLISNGNKTLLDSESVSVLDSVYIEHADIILRPYHWEIDGRTGTKAYLKTLYVTTDDGDDEFADKYADNDDCPF